MSSSSDKEDNSPYSRFTRNPNAEYNSQGLERPWPVPMTMLHTNGSILYENLQFDLLYEVIRQNHTNALQTYVTIAPWAVSIEPVLANDLWAVLDTREDCGCDVVLEMNSCMWAACQGSLDALKILLNHCTKGKDPDMEIRFESGEVLLLNQAAQYGQVKVVQFLLDNQPRYASIYECDSNDYTALLSASLASYINVPTSLQEGLPGPAESEAIIDLLLDRGASAPDVSYEDGKVSNTVLTLDAQWAGSRLIKKLINGGADIYTKVERDQWDDQFWNLRDCTYQVNALYVACTHANFEVVKTIIDCRGAEVDVMDILWQRDSRGSLPLHWVAQSDLPKETSGYSNVVIDDKVRSIANIIELLLGIDPTIINVTDNDGNTPLHYATRSPSRHDKMYTPVIQLLCARSGDASIQNTEGQTPLHTLFRLEDGGGFQGYFCKKNPVDQVTVMTLLAHGTSAVDIDMAGDTPLHLAAANLEWADIVSLLLVHGDDPGLPNLNGHTALHRAGGGTYLGRNKKYTAPERTRAQEDVLSRLMKAGGVDLMDLTDAEGMKPRDICHKTRQEWKELDSPRK